MNFFFFVHNQNFMLSGLIAKLKRRPPKDSLSSSESMLTSMLVLA